MTLLTYAVDLHKERTKNTVNPSTNQLTNSLQEIENLLGDLLVDYHPLNLNI